MDNIYYFSLPGWFVLGISLGIGPCMAHQMIIVLSSIGMMRNKMMAGISDYIYYTIARIISYSLMGILSGAAGHLFVNLASDITTVNAIQIILGSFMIFMSLSVLYFRKTSTCRFNKKNEYSPSRKRMALLGVLTALLPCPALMGLMAYAAASGRVLYGGLSGLALALGTSISPLLLAVPVFGYIKEKLAAKSASTILRFTAAFILFAYGFQLIISVL